MREAHVMRLVKYKKSICLHKKQKTLVKALEYVHAFFFFWVYFGIEIYFFYSIYLLFKTPHIRFFTLHFILLKYQIS